MSVVFDPDKPAYGNPENARMQHLYLDSVIETVKERGFDEADAKRLVWVKYLKEQRDAFKDDMPETVE